MLVGTPGRIKDHLQNQKLDLSKLKHVVLDEVDQMLDMGFAEQVEEILSTSYKPGDIFKYILLRKVVRPDVVRVPIVFKKTTSCVLMTFERLVFVSSGGESNPQTLLFSATCPPWVYEVAKKYMRQSFQHVDLIGKKTQRAATTVEVSVLRDPVARGPLKHTRYAKYTLYQHVHILTPPCLLNTSECYAIIKELSHF